jgi:predicted XRE-type DNA-binding protein
MKKKTAKSAFELSELLGLNASDAIEAELKASLMLKIRTEIERNQLTHQEVSDLSGVGRTVITGIVNCSIQRITLDRLVRVLSSLGVRAELKFKKAS